MFSREIFIVAPCNSFHLKQPRTPNTLGMAGCQNTGCKQLMKHTQSRTCQPDVLTHPAPIPQTAWSLDVLPRTVACAMNQGSNVTSVDFHPSHQTLLLGMKTLLILEYSPLLFIWFFIANISSVIVGTETGEITLWEIGLRDRLVSKPFKLQNIASYSSQFQAAVVKDSSISVTKVSWSPEGNLIGGFAKRNIFLFHVTEERYDASTTLILKQIEAHVGGVNDIAFSHPKERLSVVTCGDDKLIQVWDLIGHKLYTLEGHEAPVYSICPHHKEHIQGDLSYPLMGVLNPSATEMFVYSLAIDGKIKAWLYDNLGSRVDYDAPGNGCTTMLYSSDGSRLFCCGTSSEGDSFLVEWSEHEGAIKRTYVGFQKKSVGVVQFDTTQNHFLAAGEDNQIKFWDMDNVNLLTSTDAEGGLQSLPRLRFSKEGNLLAATTVDNGFKILANAEGHRSLRAFESRD
ncbi:putative transcription factor WD40-like family [Dioscorea sansibarensis]